MSKRILMCCDGTWDSTSNQTNVVRIFNALRTTAEQVPFYDTGVGADSRPLERLTGGAFGLGLFRKIKAAYTKIAHVYEAGDEVFLFGFSRGAYTARSVAGMIAACGLPTKNFADEMVDQIFDAYRSKDQRAEKLKELSQCCLSEASITMLGVWDTVGALGIPAVLGGVDPMLYGFLDTSLHANVRHAYHALAIDERRIEFPPTLWDSAPAAGQTIEQVWFPGVHCDVGGGYPPDAEAGTALSDITLGWMMSKAKALGADFDPAALTRFLPCQLQHALDHVHESWKPFWGIPKRRSIPENSVVSNSVLARFTHDQTYRPPNLMYSNGSWTPACKLSAILEDVHLA